MKELNIKKRQLRKADLVFHEDTGRVGQILRSWKDNGVQVCKVSGFRRNFIVPVGEVQVLRKQATYPELEKLK